MDLATAHAYCLAKPGVEETFPFNETTLVFKVAGKMYALLPLDEEELSLNLKCDPDRGVELREQYPDAILPGYHMSKIHWNTIYPERDLPDALVRELIDHSYDLIVAKLPKAAREALQNL